MNNAQTIFSIFYGLYFASSVSLTGKLSPFPTAEMWQKSGRAWIRFCFSLVFLNLLPLIYFVFVYGWLAKLDDFEVGIGSMSILLILSLAGFGFYRMFYGFMLLRENRGSYVFYGKDLPQPFSDDLKSRTGQNAFSPHFFPGLIWVSVTLFVGWVWTR